MNKNYYYLIFLMFPFFLFSLEVRPWFGDVYEFNFTSQYTYSHFSSVNGAVPPLEKPSNDNVLYFDLAFPFSSPWCVDMDLSFAQTPRQSFSFRSTALQFRYLWLDDIVGDWISLTTGGNFRFVSNRSIKDISCPYHGDVSFELNLAIGKEIDVMRTWRFCLWAYGLFGIANRGSPWIGGIFGLDGVYDEKHKGAIVLDYVHGYGKKTTIDINNFNGYAQVREKALDISFQYGQRLGVWGSLYFEYRRRLVAKLCPSNVNFFTLRYILPFSF